MLFNAACAYGIVAIMAAVIVFGITNRLSDERRPTGERFALSALAGLLWPVLILGVVEVGSFAAYAKVQEHVDDEPPVEALV